MEARKREREVVVVGGGGFCGVGGGISRNFAQRHSQRREKKLKSRKKDKKVEDGFTSLTVHKIILIHFSCARCR
jgi:hypothetical protein